MPIGEPVSALDPDEDILFYELLDTPDLRDTPDLEDGDDLEEDEGDPRFTIDSLTGQIRVGKVLGADPGKREDDPDERECDLGEGEAGPGEREDEDSTALVGGPALPPGERPTNAATASMSCGCG